MSAFATLFFDLNLKKIWRDASTIKFYSLKTFIDDVVVKKKKRSIGKKQEYVFFFSSLFDKTMSDLLIFWFSPFFPITSRWK